MGTGARQVGGGRLTLEGMLSLEPWTIGTLVYASGHEACGLAGVVRRSFIKPAKPTTGQIPLVNTSIRTI